MIASAAFLTQRPLAGTLVLESEALLREVVCETLGMGRRVGCNPAILSDHPVIVDQAQSRDRVEPRRASLSMRPCKIGRSPETVGPEKSG